jgi:hypothetical protein
MPNKKDNFGMISTKKWQQIAFIVVFGLATGALSLLNKPTSLGPVFTFVLMSGTMMYLLYLVFGGVINQISAILPDKNKKVVTIKGFLVWVIAIILLFTLGALIVSKINSVFLVELWVYSVLGLLIVYPCIISLSIYYPSFQYLRTSKDDYTKKKSIVNSLIFLTISLATPWLFILLLISYTALPIWANFVIALSIYIAIFFGAIDFPYYLSMESTKKEKVNELELKREKLVDKVNDEKEINERLAIELNIQRIDRDIERVKSESSHPYLFLKPIAGFVVVSILANLLVEILKVVLKV